MTALALPELLTHDQALMCVQSLQIRASAELGDSVVIDASTLKKFDSSALAALLQCRRDAAVMGKSFKLSGLPQQVRELANLYGIRELLESH
jgi:phospholipid transport system transporter-binding protein